METQEIDVRDAIMDKMNKEGRKLSWLSTVTGINYSTLRSILVFKVIALSEINQDKINRALESEF